VNLELERFNGRVASEGDKGLQRVEGCAQKKARGAAGTRQI